MHQLSDSGRLARVVFPILSRNAQWRDGDVFRFVARDRIGAAPAIVADGHGAAKPQVIRIGRK